MLLFRGHRQERTELPTPGLGEPVAYAEHEMREYSGVRLMRRTF